jgi:hypothetical protein
LESHLEQARTKLLLIKRLFTVSALADNWQEQFDEGIGTKDGLA